MMLRRTLVVLFAAASIGLISSADARAGRGGWHAGGRGWFAPAFVIGGAADLATGITAIPTNMEDMASTPSMVLGPIAPAAFTPVAISLGSLCGLKPAGFSGGFRFANEPIFRRDLRPASGSSAPDRSTDDPG
jgi:hypothetical protein